MEVCLMVASRKRIYGGLKPQRHFFFFFVLCTATEKVIRKKKKDLRTKPLGGKKVE